MPSIKPKILIIDDEKNLLYALKAALGKDFTVFTSDTFTKGFSILNKRSIDLVLLDVMLPNDNGIEILEKIKKFDESISVIMITGVLTVNTAVTAIKKGAFDYITKPFNTDQLKTVIEKALQTRELAKENIRLREQVEKFSSFENIVSRSKKMMEIFEIIEEVSKNPSTVIIYGESGTGKELVARAIHNRSDRAQKPFIPINCAAIPESLIESELFGHEKGSFTGAHEQHLGKFESAAGGTLFLDEIGSLPLSMQGKLLRTLQEKVIERVGGTKQIPVNVRIISATNKDLLEAANTDKFRKDLYYRLNVIPIDLPPLRARKDDIPLLVYHFIQKYNKEYQRNIKGATKEAIKVFKSYNWPGNIRELENLIARLIVLSKDEYIGIEKLPDEILKNSKDVSYEGLSLKEAARSFETAFIQKAIEKAGGSKNKTAKILGIHRNTLLKLTKKDLEK